MTQKSYPVLSKAEADKKRFVEFWAERYHASNERLYEDNIGSLTEQAVRGLFDWKSSRTRKTVEEKLLPQLSTLRNREPARDRADEDVASSFLNEWYSIDGPILRIFFLHIWQPKRFPIYDQFVDRAMCFIEQTRLPELTNCSAKNKIDRYRCKYLKFHEEFRRSLRVSDDGKKHSKVDKALWTFGRFLTSDLNRGLVPEVG